jgi:hypothetical protein
VDELMEDLVLLYFDPTEKQVRAATVYEPFEEDGFPNTIELFQRLYKKDRSIFFFWDHMVATLDGVKEIVGYSFYLIDLPELSQSPLLKLASNVSTFDEFSYDLLLHPSEKSESDAEQQFGIAGYNNGSDYLIVLEDAHIHPYAFKRTDRSKASI